MPLDPTKIYSTLKIHIEPLNMDLLNNSLCLNLSQTTQLGMAISNNNSEIEGLVKLVYAIH